MPVNITTAYFVEPLDLWIRVWTGPSGSTTGNSVAIDGSGNIYAVGKAWVTGTAGRYDFALIKYNSSGSVEWTRFLGGSEDEECFAVATDSTGNVIVVGDTRSEGLSPFSMLAASYDTNGNVNWQRVISAGSPKNINQLYAVATDSSNDVLVAGNTLNALTTSGQDVSILKLNGGDGTIAWQRRFGGAGSDDDDYARDIATDSSGNVYVVGESDTGTTANQAYIHKWSTSGGFVTQRQLGDGGASEADVAYGVAVDNTNNVVYMSGTTASDTGGVNKIFLAKYNIGVTSLSWQKRIGTPSGEFGEGVTVDSSGNIYVCGLSSGTGIGTQDGVIVKYDSSGGVVWQRALGISGSGVRFDRVVTNDTHLFLVGSGGGGLLFARVPTDGSGTGTVGSWTYAESSMTADNADMNNTSGTKITSGTPGLSEAAGGMTSQSSTLTEDIIN